MVEKTVFIEKKEMECLERMEFCRTFALEFRTTLLNVIHSKVRC